MTTSMLALAMFLNAPPLLPAAPWQEASENSAEPSPQEGATEGDGQEEETTPEAAPEAVEAVDPMTFLGPLPPDEEVAFWISLVDVPDREVPVTIEEWDTYYNYMRGIYKPKKDPTFLYKLLRPLLEAKLMKIVFMDKIPELEQKSAEVMRKLERGAKFDRIARLYSEDNTSRGFGGDMGAFTHSFRRYPLEHHLFDIETGAYGGPYFTKYGAEIYWIQDRKGKSGSRKESLDIAYVLLRWGPGFGGQEWTRLRRSARFRTDKERFRQFLPPALQLDPPEQFGPSDLAPLGQPGMGLTVFYGTENNEEPADVVAAREKRESEQE